MMEAEQYTIAGIDFLTVRNRMEQRVLKAIESILAEPPGYRPEEDDLQDIYALALNSLPARYAQSGSIILRDPVKDETVMLAVREAFAKVIQHPKS